MDIPTLPVFDEDEESDSINSISLTGGRLIMFFITAMLARCIKDRYWKQELGIVRRTWSDAPPNFFTSPICISLRIYANVLVAAFAGFHLTCMFLGLSLSTVKDGQDLTILGGLFLAAQLASIHLSMAPETLGEFVRNIGHIPGPCLRFALLLDLTGFLCVLPLLTCFAYYKSSPELTASTQAAQSVVLASALLVLLPGRTKSSCKAPPGGLKSNAEIAQTEAYPLNLVIRKNFMDSLPVVIPSDSLGEYHSSSSTEDMDGKQCPSLIIDAEGCSPALIVRLQQLGELKERNAAERRASLRSHQAHSAPHLGELPSEAAHITSVFC